MRQDDLLQLLEKRLFQPFRIHVTDGVHYDIRHPNQAHVTRSTVYITLPSADPSNPLTGRPMIVALIHITRLEPIVDSLSPSSN